MKILLAFLAIFAWIFIANAQVDKSVCALPKDPGPCRASEPRFYFNGKECEPFVYGSCKGNGNRFITKEECEKVCL